MPTEKYAHAPEILEHCQRIGKQYGLYDNALFHTEVTDLEWDADHSRWIIRTNRGDEFTAQFLGMGTGPLHVPKLPGIPGIESFEGHSFHTSRWDYDYTGGDPDGAPMDKLADKRVAIIGTGATSVQCVPHLARAAGELYVFQRTPSSVDVRDNRRPTPSGSPRSPRRAGSSAGWRTSPPTRPAAWPRRTSCMDGWTDLARRIRSQDHGAAAGRVHAGEHDGGVRGLRLREDGGDPGPRRLDRRGPRDRPAPQGLVPPAVQAAVLPRRVPAGVQRAGHPPDRHRRQGRRAHHRDRRRGGRRRSTRSTASSTRRASRSAPSTPAAPATT